MAVGALRRLATDPGCLIRGEAARGDDRGARRVRPVGGAHLEAETMITLDEVSPAPGRRDHAPAPLLPCSVGDHLDGARVLASQARVGSSSSSLNASDLPLVAADTDRLGRTTASCCLCRKQRSDDDGRN